MATTISLGRSRLNPAVTRLLRVTVSVGLLALVIFLADWKEVWQTLRTVEIRWVVAAIALAALDRLIINQRWQLLLEARGVDIGFAKVVRIQLGANFLGTFLPTSIGVDAIRIAALCRAGEPAPAVIAATLVDRISLILATLLLGAVMLLFFAQSFIPRQITDEVVTGTAVIFAVGAICLHKSVRRWVRLTLLPRVPERFRQTLHDIAEAALTYRHEYRAMGGVAALTLLAFVVRIYFVQALGFAVGANLSILKLAMVVPILWIIVMLPITIGGLGVQDAGYVALMALMGVPASLAVSMSLIEHLVARLGSLPGALFVGETTAKKPPSALSRRA